MDPAYTLPQNENRTDKRDVKSALSDINQEFKEETIAGQAQQLGISYVNLTTTPINPDYLRILSLEEAIKSRSISYFRLGKKLKLAVMDPDNEPTRHTIGNLQQQGYTVFLALMSPESLQHGLDLYAVHNIKEEKVVENTVDEAMLEVYEKEIQNLNELGNKLKDISAEEGLNLILVGGYKTGASDIHIDPEEDRVRLRFRIDGVIQNIFTMERKTYEKLVTQIKYDGKMRLNVSSVPQDGRTSFKVNKNQVDVRISTLPTEFGETILLRLLDTRNTIQDFEELGYSGTALNNLENAIGKSHGMILVTGPTGSGKTTSLYAILQKLNRPENKIITLEDPIEYHIPQISQSQINEKNGYDFAGALRASLRQDPDIIMVGEIRDTDTAQIALQAALTGHIVLSTLHTNSALDSIPRLINMGIKPFMIAPALNAVVAQRLVRRVCKVCKTNRPLTETEKAEIAALQTKFPTLSIHLPEEVTSPNPSGCDRCSHTGYKGRIALVEVLVVDAELRQLIFDGASVQKMERAAIAGGFMNMHEYGLIQALEGKTSLEEVYRVAAV